MSVTDYSSAVDAMYGLILPTLAAMTPALSQTYYPGKDAGASPDNSTYYARVSEQIVTQAQDAVGIDIAQGSGSRFKTTGLFFVQLFCPKSDAKSVQNGRIMAQQVLNTLRSYQPDLTLLNATIKPIIYNDDNYQFNIVATFWYYEFSQITI
jgi:hypothetical protein